MSGARRRRESPGGGVLRPVAEDPEQAIRIDPDRCCDLNSWRDWTAVAERGGLREVQRDLTGFLASVAAWAEATVPHRAAELIAELDHSPRSTAPLG